MPTIDQNTGQMGGALDKTSAETKIAELRGLIEKGATISTTLMNKFHDLWNKYNGHTHSITDLYGIDTYGNVGSYGGTGAYDSDTAVNSLKVSGLTDIDSVTTTELITAEYHANLYTHFVNNAPQHTHTWDDRTS